MKRHRPAFSAITLCLATILVYGPATAQQPVTGAPSNNVADPPITQSSVDALLRQLAAHEARIKELEEKLRQQTPATSSSAAATAAPVQSTGVTLAAISPSAPEPSPGPSTAGAPAPGSVVPAADSSAAMAMTATNMAATSMDASDPHDHMISMGSGGPTLKIRGFFDFNYGVGSVANPLIYPVNDGACGTCGNPTTPAHNAFQAGEFDLFMSSKLSEHLSFLGEIVLGPSDTNLFGLDIERYQLTYKANKHFSASLGRFHTSIGYYNTAYHHGNWFSTAEGRPIMYLFEDSGGVLPVHMVGISFSGEVPHTDALGLHWIAEIGNGLTSNSNAAESVQNFYSDRNYKATNLAFYVKPQFLQGLQMGGSWYHDGLNPSQAASDPLPIAEVRQNIESAYIVFFSSNWEFMNEGVMESNHVMGTAQPFRSPMAYAQVARKFGVYKPYLRYQYVRDNMNDPLNLLKGTFYGPSVGMRVDMFEYAAFKLQFNHLYQSSQLAGNGLDAQIAFTF